MRNYTDNDIDEDMKLTRRDYIKILHHYQPKNTSASSSSSRLSLKQIKHRAHRILADKLCRCIKASDSVADVDASRPPPRDESRRIAYCSRSIFNNRGLRQHGFTCKDTAKNGKRGKFVKDVTKTRRILRL
ncbi:hypothetical protein EBV26_12930 [bacterium]|nr:hypothetical protein [bacterium]